MEIDPRRFKAAKKIDEETWADWLNDAPPPTAVRQEVRQKRVERANDYVPRRAVAPVQQGKPSDATASAAVSIQINMPAFHKPQWKRSKAAWKGIRPHLTRARMITISSIIIVMFGAWLGLHALKVRHDRQTAQTAAGSATATSGGAAISKPSFTPAVPSSSPQLAIPDGSHSRYDASRGSYTFYDAIGSKQFTVSEQQLATASAVQAAVQEAAKSLNATTQLKTGWGTAYVIHNQKYTSDSLVLGVKDLLVFIQTPGSVTLTNDQWTTYINSLQ